MKLLLIEFLVADSFHCAVSFPYIQGTLRHFGMSTLMVSIALKSGDTYVSETDDRVIVPQDGLTGLKQAAKKFDPTHILFSHKCDATSLDQIIPLSNYRVGHLCDGYDIIPLGSSAPVSVIDWLGLAIEKSEQMFQTTTYSDFSSVPANSAAKAHRPLPHIVCEFECRYNAPLVENPIYKNIDLTGCIHDSKCAFCCMPSSSESKFCQSPVGEFAAHLKNAATTTNWLEHKPRYRVIGYSIIQRLKSVCEKILTFDLPASDFLFNCRVDEIVRNREAFNAGLTLLKKTGHRVFIALMGIENFADDELLRFNKGFGTIQILEMLSELFDLKRHYPEQFDFHTYGGFSTILYTPWTTLENVEFNLRLVELLGLHPLCGKLLTSRLRLYKELPIYRLAAAQELIEDSYDDPFFNTAHANFYPSEIPWKFKDTKVELFNRTASRLVINSNAAEDPLYVRVQQWFQNEFIPGTSRITAALTLVDKLKQRSTTSDLNSLLAPKTDNKNPYSVERLDVASLRQFLSFKKFLFQKNENFVGKLEYIDAGFLDDVDSVLEDSFGTHVGTKINVCAENDGLRHVFFGLNIVNVERAAALSTIIENHSNADAEIAEVGELLGYPACCAKAFSNGSSFALKYNEWMHLGNRIKIGKESVDERMNPFVGPLTYVPCSLDCGASLTLFEEFSNSEPGKMSATFSAPSGETMKSPVLYLFDSPGSFVLLNGSILREIGENAEITFSSATIAGADEQLKCFTYANRIVIRTGIIDVYRDNTQRHSFVMTAAIWWYRKSFHNPFWKYCYELARTRNSLNAVLNSDGGQLPAHFSTPYTEEQQVIADLLRYFSDTIREKTGYHFETLYFAGKKTELLFHNRKTKVFLEVSRANETQMSFLTGTLFSINYIRGTRLNRDVQRLSSLLLKILEGYYTRIKERNRV